MRITRAGFLANQVKRIKGSTYPPADCDCRLGVPSVIFRLGRNLPPNGIRAKFLCQYKRGSDVVWRDPYTRITVSMDVRLSGFHT